jgi:hypothetical protein
MVAEMIVTAAALTATVVVDETTDEMAVTVARWLLLCDLTTATTIVEVDLPVAIPTGETIDLVTTTEIDETMAGEKAAAATGASAITSEDTSWCHRVGCVQDQEDETVQPHESDLVTRPRGSEHSRSSKWSQNQFFLSIGLSVTVSYRYPTRTKTNLV